MTPPLDELKIRARVRLNAARRADPATDLKLRDCLHDAARAVGFAHWEHARRVLGGQALPGEDMGTFWHAPRTGILLNLWFARYDQALPVLDADRRAFLLPYRRQCLIVQDHFIRELGVDPDHPAWAQLRHDLVGGYGSSAWAALAMQRLRGAAQTFEPG